MIKNYEEKILAFLNESSAPSDIEKIRTSAGIGNWNTALKHCLQLLLKGKIQGHETTKGWVFWTHQTRHLQNWEEIIGILDRIEPGETETTAIFTCIIQKQIAIALPKDEVEINQLEELIGKKIGILKTDNPQKPIIIKKLDGTPGIGKSMFTKTVASLKLVMGLRLSWLRSSLRYSHLSCV